MRVIDCHGSWDYMNETFYASDATSKWNVSLLLHAGQHGI